MDKRSILALVLIAAIILGGEMLRVKMFPPPPAPLLTDSITATLPSTATSDTLAARQTPQSAAPSKTSPGSQLAAKPAPLAAPAETISVTTADRVVRFTSAGAAPIDVALPEYKDLKRRSGSLVLAPNNGPLMRLRLVDGADTIRLESLTFTASKLSSGVEFTSAIPAVRVRYEVTPNDYITHASVTLGAAHPGAHLLVDMAPDLRSGEADTTEDLRHLAYGFRPAKHDVESLTLQKLDTAKVTEQPGPLEWVAIRNKYFVYAVIPSDTVSGVSSVRIRGGHPLRNGLPTGIATASMNLAGGAVSFDLYTGPQSWKSLRDVGHELSNVNPYAGWSWLRPAVQPFATIVMRLLLWIKGKLNVSYGWVLVIFGVSIRVILWPLYKSSMRTSLRMQKIQPELTALQKRYAKDPEGQRVAMMKLYQEHGMSPFSPLMGCLPMVIPMPILFALYFVFQNTIEFRGVQFLWLPDISLRDPFYITPIVMGLSMLVLSWIGMRSAPPNPQAKVMGYMMPAMFTLMFLNLASGLNLYYAVQNLVAIPQQWLLTRERTKATASRPPALTTK